MQTCQRSFRFILVVAIMLLTTRVDAQAPAAGKKKFVPNFRGNHTVVEDDWRACLDFADRHLGRRPATAR